MHLFTAEGTIRKFENPEQVMAAFYGPRLELYHSRKAAMLKRMEDEWTRLSNQVPRAVTSSAQTHFVYNVPIFSTLFMRERSEKERSE